MPQQSKVAKTKLAVITDTSISDRCSSAGLMETPPSLRNISCCPSCKHKYEEHANLSFLLGSSFLKGLLSIGCPRRPPVPYHYNEHASRCQAGIVRCRDRSTAYTVTLFKPGSLSPWCSSHKGRGLVITYSPAKWAKKDLHNFKERQESGTNNM